METGVGTLVGPRNEKNKGEGFEMTFFFQRSVFQVCQTVRDFFCGLQFLKTKQKKRVSSRRGEKLKVEVEHVCHLLSEHMMNTSEFFSELMFVFFQDISQVIAKFIICVF